jgi:lambda family phage minor tail protein L
MVNENFTKEANKQVNKPIYLYTLFDYNGIGNDLNWCEWDSNITFDGVEYEHAGISHDEIGENAQGQIDGVKVKTSNISREIQANLETYDFRGKKLRVRLVWYDKLDDPDCKLDFIYFIDSYTADQEFVEFTLLPKTDVLSVVLPTRNYSRHYCGWIFKSSECGYAGGETICNKTKQRCKELDNYQRFGGFPGIPSRTVIIQ